MAATLAPERYARWIDELRRESRMRDTFALPKWPTGCARPPAFVGRAGVVSRGALSHPTHDAAIASAVIRRTRS